LKPLINNLHQLLKNEVGFILTQQPDVYLVVQLLQLVLNNAAGENKRKIKKQYSWSQIKSMFQHHSTIMYRLEILSCEIHQNEHINLTIVRSPEARDDTRSFPARAQTIVLCAPDTAGP
jgi:hypothetical protein